MPRVREEITSRERAFRPLAFLLPRRTQRPAHPARVRQHPCQHGARQPFVQRPAIGALDHRPRIAGPLVIASGGGEIFALDSKTGGQKWRIPAKGKLIGAGSDGTSTALTLKVDDGSKLVVVGADGSIKVDKTTEMPLARPAVVILGSGPNRLGQGVEFDLGDIFSDFFCGTRGTKRGRDISLDIELSFREAVFGPEPRVLFSQLSTFHVLAGTGAKKGSKTITCPTCNGKGDIRETRSSFFGAL